jgi:hypothetical protein
VAGTVARVVEITEVVAADMVAVAVAAAATVLLEVLVTVVVEAADMVAAAAVVPQGPISPQLLLRSSELLPLRCDIARSYARKCE